MRHRIWISSADTFQAALLICCAWGKLSWSWFWIFFALETLNSWAFDQIAKRERVTEGGER